MRVSKDPLVRRKELIDIAEKLFLKKGYEGVSVRDILKEVGGGPGMFYYYFESKEDIYKTVMVQYSDRSVKDKVVILRDKTLSLPMRFQKVLALIKVNFQEYISAFNKEESQSYEIRVFMSMLDLLIDPFTEAIMEAKESGLIQVTSIIQEKNARQAALFILHGVYGLLHEKGENGISFEIAENNMNCVIPFVCQVLGISLQKFMEGCE